MAWQPTVAESEVPLGSCREIAIGNDSILLVRTGTGFFACAPVCPHKMMSLEAGEVDGNSLTCPLHGATFDLATGNATEDTDWAGDLDTYPCEVRDGVVHVLL